MRDCGEHITTDFLETISLDGTDKVKLMNRIDNKFWFHRDALQSLLNEVQDNYFIMEIGGTTILPYTSTYYDTSNDHMFIAHQNGKKNRYKIRRRTYLASNMSFLEVKFKTNKGRTIKKRIATSEDADTFNEEEQMFIKSVSPFSTPDLSSVLVNRFSRITLVNKDFSERCTIDLDLRYQQDVHDVALDNLIIVEIKSDRSSDLSPLGKALRKRRINSSSFSKYCVGRTVTGHHLKRNRFKKLIRQIERHIEPSKKLYNA